MQIVLNLLRAISRDDTILRYSSQSIMEARKGPFLPPIRPKGKLSGRGQRRAPRHAMISPLSTATLSRTERARRQAAHTMPPPPTRINLWIAARSNFRAAASSCARQARCCLLAVRLHTKPPRARRPSRSAEPRAHGHTLRRSPAVSSLSVCRDRSYSAPPFTRCSDCLRWCN